MLSKVGYIYGANLVNGILGLIAIPIGLHQLHATGYGLFAIYLIIVSYSQFFELGMTKSLARSIAQANGVDEQCDILTTAITVFILIACTLIVLSPLIIYLATHYIFPAPTDILSTMKLIIAFGLLDYLLSIPTNIIKSYSTGLESFRTYSIFSVFSGLFRYTIMIVAFFLFNHSISLVVLFSLSYRLVDLIIAQRIMTQLPKHCWRPTFNVRKIGTMLYQTLQLSTVQMAQTVMLTMGSIITSHLFGLAALGIYQAAFNIASKLWFFSNGIGLVIFPRFSKQALLSNAERRTVIQSLKIILRVSWLGYLLVAGVAILVSPFLLNIFHVNVNNAQPMLALLFIGMAMNAHSNISFNFLQASKRYKTALIMIVLSTFLLIVISIYLKANEGILAIGWAWLISQFIYAVTLDIFVVKNDIYDLLIKVFFFIATIATIKLNINIAIFYAFYFLLLLCFFGLFYYYRNTMLRN